jgi:integrase
VGLTQKQIEKLNTPGRYRDGHQLYLQVQSPTNKSWLFRYTFGGRERFMGLGPLHTIDLEEARERARQARKTLLDGSDPLALRAAEAAQRALVAARSITFEKAAQQYYEAHEASWKNKKHRLQFRNSLRDYALPRLGKLPVADIDVGLVLQCVEQHWTTKTQTMSRVRGRVESILDWCMVRGYRTGENPARWKGHLEQILPARGKVQKTIHFAALAMDDVPAFCGARRKQNGVAARALEFTILTAARTGEVIGAHWSEIDFASATWTIPAGRMKASKEHRVPLSKETIEILAAMPRERDNQFVFIGPHKAGLSHTAMAGVLARMGRRDVTVHGMRSTFRTWAGERTRYHAHVIEMCLAHNIGSAVERAYARGDLLEKRRRLMSDLGRYCTSSNASRTRTRYNEKRSCLTRKAICAFPVFCAVIKTIKSRPMTRTAVLHCESSPVCEEAATRDALPDYRQLRFVHLESRGLCGPGVRYRAAGRSQRSVHLARNYLPRILRVHSRFSRPGNGDQPK